MGLQKEKKLKELGSIGSIFFFNLPKSNDVRKQEVVCREFTT
jgi:hypothetical protein